MNIVILSDPCDLPIKKLLPRLEALFVEENVRVFLLLGNGRVSKGELDSATKSRLTVLFLKSQNTNLAKIAPFMREGATLVAKNHDKLCSDFELINKSDFKSNNCTKKISENLWVFQSEDLILIAGLFLDLVFDDLGSIIVQKKSVKLDSCSKSKAVSPGLNEIWSMGELEEFLKYKEKIFEKDRNDLSFGTGILGF